jgi:uncharacterized membrane-anchored protein
VKSIVELPTPEYLDHPLRAALAAELHARPFLKLAESVSLIHYAVFAEHKLREERIEGMPTIQEFMERRFAPAMETCRSVWARHEVLAARIARAVDLLRTRVNLTQERDVTRLLGGIERTARNQLHLQHAVEGLSVTAISYYVLSLVAAAFKALHVLSLPIQPELDEGLAIGPVVLAVIVITRRTRSLLLKRSAGTDTNDIHPLKQPI